MSRRCDITQKGVMTGNNVSHAKNRNRRRFLPNLQNVSFISEALGQNIRLRLSTKAIRTIEKNGGLDSFLMGTANSKLTDKILRLKKQIASKIEKASA